MSSSEEDIPCSQPSNPIILSLRESMNDSSEDEACLQASQILDPDVPPVTETLAPEVPHSSIPSFPTKQKQKPEEPSISYQKVIESDIKACRDFERRYSKTFSDQDLEEFAKTATPKATLKRNNWAVHAFESWGSNRNNCDFLKNPQDKYTRIDHSLQDLPTEELNYWLSKFVVEITKLDGESYPPKSLIQLVMGIQSFLRLEKKISLNFLTSPDFESFRQVLDAELKRLSKEGLGSKVKQAQAITEDQENRLWEKKLLGDFNPRVLLRTILVLNGKNFALRAAKEHRDLRYKDSQIELFEPKNARSYLQYTEDVSKTRQGGLKHLKCKRKVVVQHENVENSDRCHVRIYKKYMEMSPKLGRDPNFYLTPLQRPRENIWFSLQPVGVNTLSKYTSQIFAEAGIEGHFTNHSWRATTATRLYSHGVSEQLIMERTGHASVEAVRSYKRTSEEQQQAISDILNQKEPKRQRLESDDDEPPETFKEDTSLEPSTSQSNPTFLFENCNVTFNM